MSVTARSTPNIALIKYWGNRNDDLRLPAASSLSVTLSNPDAKVTVEHADYLMLNSDFKELTPTDIGRFEKTFEQIQQYLTSIGFADVIPASLNINISSTILPGVGLASSSAVFSALAKAIAGLIDVDLTDQQISVMARLGSGSASRSIFGGYASLTNVGDDMDGAIAAQIADENHWPLNDIIIAPSQKHKKVGSTEGHRSAHSSPHFDDRIKAIEQRRQQECVDAILQKDFEKLQKVAEEDCMDMHNVMQTQIPPLNYLSEDTHRIIDELKSLREANHIPVLFTMDAGPTVHLFCEDEAVEVIKEFAHAQEGCKVFEATIGPGTHLV